MELINEMPLEEGIAIHQEKLFFYQKASTALEQVVGSLSVVALRTQLRKSSDVT